MKFILKKKLSARQIEINKKPNLTIILLIFRKFFPKIDKRILKYLCIQKKGIKELIKADLINKYSYKQVISCLNKKKRYVINLHTKKFLVIKIMFLLKSIKVFKGLDKNYKNRIFTISKRINQLNNIPEIKKIIYRMI